jgi:hypothetical protein
MRARPGMMTQAGVHPLALVPAAPVLALGAVNAVPGSIGVVEGGTIPYQPWAAAQKKDNAEHWLDRDPEVGQTLGKTHVERRHQAEGSDGSRAALPARLCAAAAETVACDPPHAELEAITNRHH